MNSDSASQPKRPHPTPQPSVERSGLEPSKAENVPVFNCIVYVSSVAGDGARVRVANLAGLECTAASEREGLAKIVSAFKQRLREHMQDATPIPWIEPPNPVEPGEQTRFIAVHL